MLITDHPHTVFPTIAAAQAAVAVLDDGEDFAYVVVADPTGTGKAIVEVHDIADGAFIANV
jgi:cobalamin biosynthesis protein CbiD